jgi:hypothetical protein
MKYRNPMNHSSVMYKKSAVIDAGSYQDFFLNEYYYLWVRMSVIGNKFYNFKEPLLLMRVTPDSYARRGGMTYFLAQQKLLKFMRKKGFINLIEFAFNTLIRLIVRVLMPNKIRMIVYQKLLRK